MNAPPSPTGAKSLYTLRLFHQSNPTFPIDTRPLEAGELTIGRDPEANWTIEDPDRELSRLHCVVELGDAGLTVRDTSSNGVFLGQERRRPASGEAAPIEAGETLRLGRYLIVVEGALQAGPSSFDAPFNQPMLKPAEAEPIEALSVPTDWARPVERTVAPTAGDGSLLEAFCAGARLDASAFSDEDPAEVMRSLGAVYQQMVLGLADLMNERTTVKTDYRLERTTVRAEGNNPFRWAPAHRVAVDLLRTRDDGFLSGPLAVKASFEDLKKHLLCMLAGLQAALASTLDNLSPEAVEEQLTGRSFLKTRGDAAWSRYVEMYEEFKRRAGDDPDSPMNREFRAAYGRRLRELDSISR
jgi:predicted component of type VI protein secretion system